MRSPNDLQHVFLVAFTLMMMMCISPIEAGEQEMDTKEKVKISNSEPSVLILPETPGQANCSPSSGVLKIKTLSSYMSKNNVSGSIAGNIRDSQISKSLVVKPLESPKESRCTFVMKSGRTMTLDIIFGQNFKNPVINVSSKSKKNSATGTNRIKARMEAFKELLRTHKTPEGYTNIVDNYESISPISKDKKYTYRVKLLASNMSDYNMWVFHVSNSIDNIELTERPGLDEIPELSVKQYKDSSLIFLSASNKIQHRRIFELLP